MRNMMIKVIIDLCLGCGLCAQNCPTGAISLYRDLVAIDQSKFNQCRLCVDVCPHGAIVPVAPVSKEELQATVTSLRQKTSDLIERIENMKSRSR